MCGRVASLTPTLRHVLINILTQKTKNSSPGVNLPPMDGWMDGKDGGEDVFVLCAPGREWTLCGNGDRP